MPEAASITGRCICGAVRFTLSKPPIEARACWCRLCQYLGAGSGTVNIVFPADALTVAGEVRWHVSTADSGNRMRRGFCPACGTPVFSNADVRPHLTVIRAGALDDPECLAPQKTIWTCEAPGWACVDPALPRFERQPPPA